MTSDAQAPNTSQDGGRGNRSPKTFTSGSAQGAPRRAPVPSPSSAETQGPSLPRGQTDGPGVSVSCGACEEAFPLIVRAPGTCLGFAGRWGNTAFATAKTRRAGARGWRRARGLTWIRRDPRPRLSLTAPAHTAQPLCFGLCFTRVCFAEIEQTCGQEGTQTGGHVGSAGGEGPAFRAGTSRPRVSFLLHVLTTLDPPQRLSSTSSSQRPGIKARLCDHSPQHTVHGHTVPSTAPSTTTLSTATLSRPWTPPAAAPTAPPRPWTPPVASLLDPSHRPPGTKTESGCPDVFPPRPQPSLLLNLVPPGKRREARASHPTYGRCAAFAPLLPDGLLWASRTSLRVFPPPPSWPVCGPGHSRHGTWTSSRASWCLCSSLGENRPLVHKTG
ncbi:uncharacterized protein LOC131830042 [Mustela lutreola]|uniref:uncharacterized protein LOC131830042 n=1 Tax=Mustela lutreola TaxID=9666 RepID=UPI002796E9CC|nr:uncharacterized protein LOC131830042 [Mustela lutreola]